MSVSTICHSCLRAIARQGTRNGYVKNSGSFKSLTRGTASTCNPRSKVVSSTSLIARRYASSNAVGAIDEEAGEEASPSAQRRAKAMRMSEADFTEHEVAREATETLLKECARQADYIVPEAFEGSAEIPKTSAGEDLGKGTGWWYDDLGLKPTFNTWAQVTYLHMYLITVRLRYFPESYAKIWQQHFTDHFFWEAEHRMTIFHKQTSRAMRQAYLKELHNQWRGVIAAYDEGLIKGDAVMAAAVWRNIFKADENVDWSSVAVIVSYMRRIIKGLDATPDKRIIDAMVRFGTPANEVPLVEAMSNTSKGCKAPLSEEDQTLWQAFEKTGKIPLESEAAGERPSR